MQVPEQQVRRSASWRTRLRSDSMSSLSLIWSLALVELRFTMFNSKPVPEITTARMTTSTRGSTIEKPLVEARPATILFMVLIRP